MKQFALIGCGEVAAQHAKNIARVGKLKAVCDVVKEKTDAFAKEYNAVPYTSPDDLLAGENEVDVVVVCTPNGLHAEHCIKSLQAGKHVLSESPLCLTSAGAWQTFETEKYCRRKLYVVRSARFHPVLQNLKKIISENGLGKLYSFHLSCLWHRAEDYYKDWKGTLFPDGGTLYTQFSSYIDVMQWLFGDVGEAKGFKKNAAHQASIEFEDTGTVALQMKNEVLGTLHWSVNTFQKNAEAALTILAEKGTLRIGGEHLNELQYHLTSDDVRVLLSDDNSGSESSQSLDSAYDEFMQILDEYKPSYSGTFEGLKTVETIEKIYKALP